MPNNKADYIIHIHQDTSILTVGDYILDQGQPGHGMNVRDLLFYEDENGTANYINIFNILAVNSKDEYNAYKDIFNGINVASESSLNSIPLKIGVPLFIPISKMDRYIGITESNQVNDNTTFKAFLADKLKGFLLDNKYRKAYNSNNGKILAKEIFPHLSIWCWSRTLSTNEDGTVSDQVVNLTKFISDSVEINVSDTGGNFSFSLSPLIANYDLGWKIDTNTLKKVNSGQIVIDSYLLTSIKNKNQFRRNFYFNNILQQNDVVFIKFEKLDIETKSSLDSEFIIDKSNLEGQVFDMIGLIDSVSFTNNSQNIDFGIRVQGRDLAKLLIEDGVYFYPLQFIGDGIFANDSGATNEKLLRYDGNIMSRFSVANRTISSSLKFIVNALSTINITTDSLFESYKDKRSKAYQLSDDAIVDYNEKFKNQEIEVSKIKDLIKLSIQQDEIDKNPNELKIESVYSTIVSFLSYLIEQKISIESAGELIGWNSLTYLGQYLKNDQITNQLDGFLFKSLTSWRDYNGNIITDSERNKLISDLENKAELLGNKIINDPNTNKIKDQILGDKDYFEKVLKGNDYKFREYNKIVLEIDNAKYVNPNGFVQEAFNTEQKNELKDLEDRYNLTKNKLGSFSLVEIPQKLESVNSFAQKAIKGIYKILKENNKSDVPKRTLKDVKGIWQIIKLVVDDSIANRRIIDPTIGNEHGSLMNAINKLCQKPFVEFFTDTYGDQFYFIVRKSPFDKKSILSYIENDVDSENKIKAPFSSNNENKSIVIDINEDDVYSDNLSFAQQAYSWYRIQPLNMITGEVDNMAFAYLKAVYFPEYAEIYGSKPLDIPTNYLSFDSLQDKNSDLPIANFIKQAIYDLKYLIESNAYLPFTRTGTIVINGDRRIKRGTFVRLKSTGEIFYVDSVTNTFQINSSTIERTTTLKVSRGMVEDYIKEFKIGTTTYSYFNIINLNIPEDAFLNQSNGNSDFNKSIVSNWKVNKDVFNFFIRRAQFSNFTTVIG